MTLKNTKNIVTFSIVVLFTMTSFGLSNAYAEESKGYNMVDNIAPVLTFTFRDGVEIVQFPVFEMGENFASNSGTTFSVEGTVSNSPLLHKAMDEAFDYRLASSSVDYPFKYFDVDVDFVKEGESITTIVYHKCRVDNYQVETLDSNDYESYWKEIGFAIVDKIDFVCNGASSNSDGNIVHNTFTDFGESGFNFANNMRTSVTFTFDHGMEKIEFPVFNLVSAYEESSENVIAEFEVEGVLKYYPLLQGAIDNSRNLSGVGSSYNPAFNALVEFTNGESVLRGFDFSECRVSNAQITTQTDKEEGFTGKSGFVIVHQLGFTCSGISPVNMYFDELTGDVPFWKVTHVSNTFEEPLQNTDKNMSVFTTFTFDSGVEIIEFSMFKQSEMLSATEDVFISSSHIDSNDNFNRKTTYPTLELRGIVGDYPILYDYVDDNRKVQGVNGASQRELIDIDVKLMYDNEAIRGFNYSNCRPIDYVVETHANKEESYVKNKFALENIFDFECSGYTSNNPGYDAMFNVEKANTPSTFDLRNTDKWGQGFSVQK